MKNCINSLKVLGGIVGIAVATTTAPAQESGPQSETSPALEEHLKDTNSASRLSPQEELDHTVRVKRLQELEAGAEPREVISEPAGAEPAKRFQQAESGAPATSTAAGTERLIEAIEQLQMEIRELRNVMERQNPQGFQRQESIDESGGQRFVVPPN